MHVDAELVQQVLVEQAVIGQTGEHHAALRIDQHTVGMRGQVILALIQIYRPRDHRFAGGAEAIQRGADLAQRRKTAALQIIRQQHDAADALILGRGVDRADDIAQLHLLRLIARQAIERALQRVDAVLLDQLALRFEHQHAVVLQRARHASTGHAADDGQKHDEQQREKQQIDDHQPHDIDAPPQRADEGPKAARAAWWRQWWRHACGSCEVTE